MAVMVSVAQYKIAHSCWHTYFNGMFFYFFSLLMIGSVLIAKGIAMLTSQERFSQVYPCDHFVSNFVSSSICAGTTWSIF